LKTLHDPCSLLSGSIFQSCLQFFIFFIKVNRFKKLLDRLSAHSYAESAAAPFFFLLLILSLGEDLLILQVCLSFVQHDIRSKIQHSLQSPRRDIEDQSHTAGNSLEIPYMRYRSRKSDMSHTLTADAGLRNFHSTPVTYNAFVADLLIFTTVALPVFARSEDPLTEQTVFFRL